MKEDRISIRKICVQKRNVYNSSAVSEAVNLRAAQSETPVLTYIVHNYKKCFPYFVGENSPTLSKMKHVLPGKLK